MRALALETSGRIGSVALVDDGKVVAEETFPHGLQHAATVLPMIDRLMRDRGWSPSDLKHVYVSAGPGSFTGLRIAITLAKTLAMSIGAKIVAVESLRVLLANAPAEASEVILVLDAKRGQIFTARYSRFEPAKAEVSTASDTVLIDPTRDWIEAEPAHLDTLQAMLDRAGRPVHLIGEGIPYHRESIPENVGVIVADESTWRARASVVAAIGHTFAQAGGFADPLTLTPIYIRLPEAEEKRLKAEAAS